MQGYVIGIKKVKEEDLLVTVVTENKIKTMYRFYGARHSAINLGYKIDFSAEPIQNRMLLRLRDVTHLGFSWLKDRNKLLAWQGFCKLLHEHLKEVNEHGGFYFDLLENAATKIEKSKPKRVLAESYLAILKHEGRFHEPYECFFCGEEIKKDENVALSRAFLPSHEKCIFSQGFESTKIRDFFETGSTVLLNDAEVEALHGIMLLGF